MSAESERDRHAAMGAKEPTLGMLGQSEYSSGLYSEYREFLLGAGLPESKLAGVNTWRASLTAALTGKHEGTSTTEMLTSTQEAAIDGTKDHIFLLRNIVPMVMRDNKITENTAEHLLPSGSLGRSPVRIIKYLESVRGLVGKYNEQLRPYFKGESPLEVHDRVTRALAEADKAQELRRVNLPKETIDVNEAKGALIELIEDINRVGRVAFRGQAEIAAKFNKDILLRARRNRRKGGKSASDTAATATTTSTTTENPGVPE